MKTIDNYIIEKLYLNKDINISIYPKTFREADKTINDILDSFVKDKYEVSFKHSDDEQLYIEIIFEENQNIITLRNCGSKIFLALYDEEKYKKYNCGTDWWVSSPTKIILKFELNDKHRYIHNREASHK